MSNFGGFKWENYPTNWKWKISLSILTLVQMLVTINLLFLPCAEKPPTLKDACRDPESLLDLSGRWKEFTRGGGDMSYGTDVCRPFVIVDAVTSFSTETRPVLFVFLCGSFGVAVSHGRPSKSSRPPPFKPDNDETAGGVAWKGLVNSISLFNGVCKKKLRPWGEVGESGRLVACCGELNEKFAKSFLIPSSEGVPRLLGVSGVNRAGSLVRLVLRSPSVLAPGVTWGFSNGKKN